MKFQIVTAINHTGGIQIGAELVKFFKMGEQYVSEWIDEEKKHLADAVKDLKGYAVKDFDDAAAAKFDAEVQDAKDKAAQAGSELVQKAEDAAKTALEGAADKGLASVPETLKTSEAEVVKAVEAEIAKVTNPEKPKVSEPSKPAFPPNPVQDVNKAVESQVVKVDAGEDHTVQAVSELGVKTDAPLDITDKGDALVPDTEHSGDDAVATPVPADTRLAAANNPGMKQSEPDAPAQNTGNVTGPVAAMMNPASTQTHEEMDPPPHAPGGNGGTSWGPEDGKPKDAIPGTVNKKEVKTRQEVKADRKPVDTGKSGPQTD